MSILNIPLDKPLEDRLTAIAASEERTPVREVLFILRRVFGLVDDPCPCVRYRKWGGDNDDAA